MLSRRKCRFAGILLLSAATVIAQSALTSLRGNIVDSTGAAVAGAEVTLKQVGTGALRVQTSNHYGEYQFPQLTPGMYEIAVTAPGFGIQTKRAQFLVSQPVSLNFTLSVQEAATTIDVRAEDTLINSTDASIGNSLGNETIEALPMEGRNVPDLLSLQPGVLYLGYTHDQVFDSRSGAVAGGRSDQGNITLDGIDNNDQATGKAFSGVMRSTLDSAEEFRVTTTNANSDSGRSSGAQITMVTRSGTNQVHSSLYEYNRNTFFAANNWFNKQAEIEEGLPNKPGKLIRNTFGGALGGPIRKDKLFFFANLERQSTAENVQETQTVPTALMRTGNVSYLHTTSTSGGSSTSTITLDKQQIATMDPYCTSLGTCPLGPGVNPAILSLLNLYPLPNGNVSGDGYNTASYTWSAPDPATLNTSIVKLDWVPSNRHRLFVRGNLQDDTADSPPQFPGQPLSLVQRTNTKGIAAADTWTIGNNMINSIRYGFTREGYSDRGTGSGPYNTFVGLSDIYAETRNSLIAVPVQNLVDDFSWIHHNHTFQFGANYRLLHNNDSTDANSYSSATGTQGWIPNFGTAGNSFDPSAFGFPSVDSDFQLSYDNSMVVLAGLISYITNQYNYQITSGGQTGNLLPQSQFINYNFKNNEFEYYAQDAWRIKPNLTITLGLRHTLLQTPYQVNGQQVAPNLDLNSWYLNRGEQAAKGITDQPFFSFTPGGQARGGEPYWPMQKTNLAPRFAIAYSPDASKGILHTLFGDAGKSSIRAGFGVYYDHFGQGIVSSFAQYGAFGLSGSTAVNGFTADNAPRFTALQNIPDTVMQPPTVTYPFEPSTAGFAFGWDECVDSARTAKGFSAREQLCWKDWKAPDAADRLRGRSRSRGSEIRDGLLCGSVRSFESWIRWSENGCPHTVLGGPLSGRRRPRPRWRRGAR
jgi:Carboxypeptidase regulatory-like domain/TonB dependent receptor